MTIFSLLVCSLSTAMALPQQLNQQGRLLDNAGAAIVGSHDLTFRIYDDPQFGYPLWEETLSTQFENGYYSVVLGADLSGNPIEDSVLATTPLYLEMLVDGGNPLLPRKEFHATPYARMASEAHSLDGGSVNASEISVGGAMIIDSAGTWVGPTITPAWNDIQNVPADIADGDDDSLSALSCGLGQIVGWDGAGWICTDDNGLTEAEVEAFVTNDPIDLAAGSMVGGDVIVTVSTDQDALGALSCQNGDVPKWDSVLGAWNCAFDSDSLLSTVCGDTEILVYDLVSGAWACGVDTDTKLTAGEVQAMVEATAMNLAAGSQVNGEAIVSSAGCNDGEVLTYDLATADWICSSFNTLLDTDGDGVLAWLDCDDNDNTVLGTDIDADCDGIYTADDCDDNDPNSTTVSTDVDCDGVLTIDDCDDNDATAGSQAFDTDCDGVLAVDDCDDADPNSTIIANDADCDGVLSADDCDDFDAGVGSSANDADCDGIPTGTDCDDNDPNALQEYGSAADCAASSCVEILNQNASASDGNYWITVAGSGMEFYCDMSGGGWIDLSQSNLNSTGAICNTLTDSTMYSNECMMMTITSSDADNLPTDSVFEIQVYQPSLNLVLSDYTALCNIYSGNNCSTYDSDGDGGHCSNYQTILGFEDGITSGAETPDVWAHTSTFNWDPSNGGGSCGLYWNGPTYLIYAIEKLR